MLSDVAIKRAKPKDKPYKLFDFGGLFVLVNPTGSKLWRYKYRINKKEKCLALGAYPSVSLAQAREGRDKAKELVREGVDPSLNRKRIKAESSNKERTFKCVAENWLEHNQPLWTDKHFSGVKKSLEMWVYPSLGLLPIDRITAPLVLSVLRRIEASGAKETARRIRARISSIYSLAIASGLAESDPAQNVGAALKPVIKGKQPAITDLDGLKKVIRDIDNSTSHVLVVLALRFIALTATRSGETRGMRWSEVIGDEWHIPADRMKMDRPHIVPLSKQALELLDAVKVISGDRELVFPSSRYRSQELSDNSLSIVLRRAGYGGKHVPHGFRAAFSTIMNERYPSDRAIIDMMLAHKDKNKIEAAYNRAEHLDRRKELAQIWSDLLMKGLPSAPEFLNQRLSETALN